MLYNINRRTRTLDRAHLLVTHRLHRPGRGLASAGLPGAQRAHVAGGAHGHPRATRLDHPGQPLGGVDHPTEEPGWLQPLGIVIARNARLCEYFRTAGTRRYAIVYAS